MKSKLDHPWCHRYLFLRSPYRQISHWGGFFLRIAARALPVFNLQERTVWHPAVNSLQVRKAFSVVCLSLVVMSFSACQTDRGAQQQINQMRADNVALMDHYVSLRAYTEKLQKELETQGKELPKNAKPLSSLPLVYPPPGTNSRLIDQYAPDYHSSRNEAPVPNRQKIASTPNPANTAATSSFPVAPASYLEENPGPASLNSPPVGTGTIAGGNQAGVSNTNGHAAFITIRPQRFHGIELDSLPGDDGVRMIVQPRDQEGNLVLKPASIIVQLFDTTKVGKIDRGRANASNQESDVVGQSVGRWAFPKDRIQQFIASNLNLNQPASSLGIPLKFSFGGKIPGNKQLLAVVEYRTETGQVLKTKEIIHLDLTGLEKSRPKNSGNSPIPTGSSDLVHDPVWTPVRKK